MFFEQSSELDFVLFSITEKANKLYPSYILRGSINERRKNEIIAKNIPSFFEYNFVASGLIEIQKIKSPEKCRALAESEGFEPPDALTSTVFKTAAIDRSANFP